MRFSLLSLKCNDVFCIFFFTFLLCLVKEVIANDVIYTNDVIYAFDMFC
jgi:hypothetical protein